MDRIAVTSRDLAVVGYDREKSMLEVAFRGGGVYEYENVPQDIYDALMKADSHGIYFNDHIKEKYVTRKIH